jgi:hypothetical protein
MVGAWMFRDILYTVDILMKTSFDIQGTLMRYLKKPEMKKLVMI